MLSKLGFEPDIDSEEENEKRQGAEPPSDVEGRNIADMTESGTLANQNLADKKSAQNEEQLDAIKPAVAEDSEETNEVRIEDDESVGTYDAHDCGSTQKIETENSITR